MRLIAIAAAIEAITGIVAVVDPSFVSWLLFGSAMPAVGNAIGRVAGFALLALGIACLPRSKALNATALQGLLAYNALATIFFVYLGVGRELVGVLLWPAAALHGILTALITRVAVAAKTL